MYLSSTHVYMHMYIVHTYVHEYVKICVYIHNYIFVLWICTYLRMTVWAKTCYVHNTNEFRFITPAYRYTQ